MIHAMKHNEITNNRSSLSKATKYTLDDWNYNNYLRLNSSKCHRALCHEIIDKTDKICKSTNEIVNSNRNQTNNYFVEKINEIECYKQDLIYNRHELFLELDTFLIQKCRLRESLKLLRKDAMEICKKCLSAREERLEIDLVNDNVEKQLRQECKSIKCADRLMSDIIENVEEHIRCIRAVLYRIDHDIESKEMNLLIDRHNSTLKETTLNLSIYYGEMPLKISSITAREWQKNSQKNVDDSHKLIEDGKTICFSTNDSLKKIIDDLLRQKNLTEEALKNRIKETKETKEKLEEEHAEIVLKVNQMSLTIAELKKVIADKEGFIALTHTRLGNRCQRPNFERCQDFVEKSLINEVSDLRKVVAQLQQTLFEAQSSLRFLLKMQMQLEEDLNIKTNSIKIDEVYCLTLHESIDYRIF